MANPFGIIESLDNFEKAAGEFIRDGPSTGLPGYVRDGYRQRCDQFANLPPWAKLLGNGPSGSLDRICTPYWNDNGWDGPEVAPPPFEGGQCDGLAYATTISIRNPNSGVITDVTGKAIGPVTNLGLRPAGTGQEIFINSRGYAAGAGCAQTTPPTGPPAETIIGTTGANRTLEGVSVVPCGFDDNCGNPAPPSPVRPGPNPPPNPGPLPGPEPTDDPDNPTGPPLVPLPPYQDPIYGPTPIVGPTGPSGNPGDPGGGTPPPPPGDIGDPGSSSDTGAGGESEGEAPEGSILVGLKIDVLTSPPKARQFAPGVFRGACYIYMGVASNLDQDYGGSMLKSGQFFFAEKENLTHWLVSANSGYNHRVTPYYREAEE